MSQPDPYTVLGVSPGASPDEVRRAYRRLARRYHPDLNDAPDAAARFRAVRAAFEQVVALECGRGAQEAQDTSERRARHERQRTRWRAALEDIAAWFGLGPELDLGEVLAELYRRGARTASEVSGLRPALGTARVVGAGRIATTAYLTREQAASGVVLPFRFSLGPHPVYEQLRLPAGLRHGDVLQYAIEARGVRLRVEVELDVL